MLMGTRGRGYGLYAAPKCRSGDHDSVWLQELLVWQLETGEHAEFIGFDNRRDEGLSESYGTSTPLLFNDMLILCWLGGSTYVQAAFCLYADDTIC